MASLYSRRKYIWRNAKGNPCAASNVKGGGTWHGSPWDCMAEGDTCGTCVQQHRTGTCGNTAQPHCVSCGIVGHACWARECLGFTTGILRVQISNTVPLPINTVTVVGEGMTPYMFGCLDMVSYQKKLNYYAAHHCVSLKIATGSKPALLLLSCEYECW